MARDYLIGDLTQVKVLTPDERPRSKGCGGRMASLSKLGLLMSAVLS